MTRYKALQLRAGKSRAELRAQSRRATTTVDCGCGARAGQRCMSAHGKPVAPHLWRLIRADETRAKGEGQ